MVHTANYNQGSAVREKSFAFAVRVVNAYNYTAATHREYVLSKQMLRSGTAIGALVREAEQAESRLRELLRLLTSIINTTRLNN